MIARADIVTRADIVAEARTWLGTPFHHQASLRGVGADCIGVIVGVDEAFGFPEAAAWKADPRFRGYGREPDVDKLLAACNDYLDEIPVALAGLGDILQFTFLRQPMHFAIISRLNPRYVIHAYANAGKVVENAADARFWRLLRAYRYRGVA